MCEVFNHYDYPSYFHAALLTTPQVSGCPRRGQVRLDRFDGSRCFRARHQVGRSPGVMVRAKRGPSRASLAAFWRVDVDAHVEMIPSGFALLYPTYRLHLQGCCPCLPTYSHILWSK